LQLLNLLYLNEARNAAYNSFESRCLEGTRATLRTELVNWAENDDLHPKSIFWLYGMAGMGKSVVARTVAEHFDDRGHLVASFFFSRNEANRSSTKALVSTIAAQFTQESAILRHKICAVLDNSLGYINLSLAEQWERLIKEPLQQLEGGERLQRQTVIFVVDALDECLNENKEIRRLLELLGKLKDTDHVRFRVLITSRAIEPVSNMMENLNQTVKRCNLSEMPQDEINRDLSAYYKRQLGDIRQEYLNIRQNKKANEELDEESNESDQETDEDSDEESNEEQDEEHHEEIDEDWPREVDIEQLVKQAGGLFQYAQVACKIIGGGKSPADRLKMLLDPGLDQHDEVDQLDQMYSKALELSTPNPSTTMLSERKKFLESFPQVVGAFVLAFDPLSRKSIVHFLPGKYKREDVTRLLHYLHSVFYIPEKLDSEIKVIHQSFRDFLTDKDRCKEEKFQIDQEAVHEGFFHGCISLMSKLKRDMCDIKAPGARIVESKETTDSGDMEATDGSDRETADVNNVERSKLKSIKPELQYACRFWVQHLQKISKPELFTEALEFLRKHFLHWLETLSLMGQTHEALTAIISLESSLDVS
jgi:hypothetical protein